MIRIANEKLSATIKNFGAELCSLRSNGSGREHIWQAGVAWPKHAPVLFPIVGQLAGGKFRYHGREYALPRHGFAREREFLLDRRAADRAIFVLRANDASRAVYPFEFELWLDAYLRPNALRMDYEVHNVGREPLLFSLGMHPAFAWDRARMTRLEFEHDELAPIRRLSEGLIDPVPRPTPVRGRILPLSDGLFIEDAIIFDQIESRAVRFGDLTVSWSDTLPQLGLWMKPGADFLCIEPWAGYSDPLGFEGELAEKPGIVRLEPGQKRVFWWEVTIGG